MADLATAYLLAMVCYLSTGLFLHLAYMRYFYLLLALCGGVAHVGYRARARDAEPVESAPVLAPGTVAPGALGS
jgi:hypothetical protein